jgi:cobalt/nickel transport system permease protein
MTLGPELPGHPGSWLARRDARWRIAAITAWALATSMVNSLPGASLALSGSILLLCLAQLPRQSVGRRMRAIVPFALLLVLPLFLWQGGAAVQPAAILLFKMLAVLLSVMTLMGLTSTSEILDTLHAIRIPGSVINLLLLAERYGIVLSMTFNRMRRALCVRGFKWHTNRHTYQTVGIAIGSLAVRGSMRANAVGRALATRGFNGQHRSWRSYETTATDVGLLFTAVALSVAIVWWDRQFAS